MIMRSLTLILVASALFLVSANSVGSDEPIPNADAQASSIVARFYADVEARLSKKRRGPNLREAEARALQAEKYFYAALSAPANQKLRVSYVIVQKLRLAANLDGQLFNTGKLDGYSDIEKEEIAYLNRTLEEIKILEKQVQ